MMSAYISRNGMWTTCKRTATDILPKTYQNCAQSWCNFVVLHPNNFQYYHKNPKFRPDYDQVRLQCNLWLSTIRIPAYLLSLKLGESIAGRFQNRDLLFAEYCSTDGRSSQWVNQWTYHLENMWTASRFNTLQWS